MRTQLLLTFLATAASAATIGTRNDDRAYTPKDEAEKCGVKGYDRQNPAAHRSDHSGTFSTFGKCQDYCKSFHSFALGGKDCLCYTQRLTNNVNPVADSPFTFYDIDCPNPDKPDPPSKLTCNVRGFDKQTPPATRADSTSNFADFDKCHTYCKDFSSFAYGNEVCLCYEALVEGNFDPDSGSPFAFFDSACPAPPVPTTPNKPPTPSPTTLATTSTTKPFFTTTITTSSTSITPTKPTKPTNPTCFRLRARSTRKTINGEWLKPPHGSSGLLTFTRISKWAGVYTLLDGRWLVDATNRSSASRHQLAKQNYGPVYMHKNGPKYDRVGCSHDQDVLRCEVDKGDRTFTVGSVLYIGLPGSSVHYQVDLVVVPEQCPGH